MKEFPYKTSHRNDRKGLSEYLKNLGSEIEEGKYSSVNIDYEYLHLKPDPPADLILEPMLLGFKITIEVKY